MVVIVMGISGSGKKTIGELLADKMGCHFYNGDDFHPQPNLEKMEQGISLSDEDRAPWLKSLRGLIEDHIQMGRQAVIAIHFLNKIQREQLLSNLKNVHFVYLKGDFQTLLDRIRRRKNIDEEDLQRQYDLLEDSDELIVVEIEDNPTAVVDKILAELNQTSAEPSS